jgi:hypothetical protein
MTTYITAAGVTASIRAANNQGPKINITTFKIGPTIIPPTQNDPSIDITDSVYTGYPSQLQYAIVNDNTVQYIVTLDESIGPFDIGRIGLFMDNGDGTSTLFSITSIDATNPDHKFATSGTVVGNRLTYNIYLAISNAGSIANFTIQLLQLLSIPEVPSELSLPDPLHVAFNTYQVMKHSVTRVPAIGYRETPAQGRTNPAWLMSSERLIPGQGEGVVPIASTSFDTLATVGTVVGLDYTNQKIIVGEPATNKYILGIRSSQEEITNYGVYVDTVNTYTPMQRLFVDTGVNAGKLTIVANNWPIGYALGPVNTQNAVGYLCWIDFTLGFGGAGSGQPGPPGPQGPQGPPGSGDGGGFSDPGQCYLQKIGSNLILIPYNGNSILINSVIQKIPQGGVSLPPAGLNPSTLYYIYAYMAGAVMSLMASTANHVTSTVDGVEIMNTDQSKTLVGMAYTVAGPAWSDTDGQLYVLSWFNRREKKSRTFLPVKLVSTKSPTWIEVSTGMRNYFLVWKDNLALFDVGGHQVTQGGGAIGATSINFDGIFDSSGTQLLPELESSTAGMSTGNSSNLGAIGISGCKQGLPEGLHYSTVLGILCTATGTAFWRNYTITNVDNKATPVCIIMSVDG